MDPITISRLVRIGLPIVGGIIALIIVWFVAVDHGKDAMRAELQPTIDQLRSDLTTARGNAARLEASVKEQNAATERGAAIEAERLAASSAALAEAEKRAAGARATIDKLKASAATASGDPCKPSDAVLETWK